MNLSFSDNIPVYLQLVRRIRADILSGRYAAGVPFPPVRQLAVEAAVNPNTVQRALSELEAEGLLYTKGTVGRFVTDDLDVLHTARQQALQEAMEEVVACAQSLGINKTDLLCYITEKEEWEI